MDNNLILTIIALVLSIAVPAGIYFLFLKKREEIAFLPPKKCLILLGSGLAASLFIAADYLIGNAISFGPYTFLISGTIFYLLVQNFLFGVIREELLKWGLNLLFGKCNKPESKSDYALIGAVIGAGFGIGENFLYTLMTDTMLYNYFPAFVRALAPIHIACGLLMGLSLWQANGKLLKRLLALGLPILFHGLYDFLILFSGEWYWFSDFTAGQYILLSLALIFGAGLTYFMFKKLFPAIPINADALEAVPATKPKSFALFTNFKNLPLFSKGKKGAENPAPAVNEPTAPQNPQQMPNPQMPPQQGYPRQNAQQMPPQQFNGYAQQQPQSPMPQRPMPQQQGHPQQMPPQQYDPRMRPPMPQQNDPRFRQMPPRPQMPPQQGYPQQMPPQQYDPRMRPPMPPR